MSLLTELLPALPQSIVLITRPISQADTLLQLMKQHQKPAIHFPTIEIRSVANQTDIQNKLQNLKAYQWLIFISANAVNFALQANNGKIAAFKPIKIAAIGQATAQALQKWGLTVNLLPQQGFNSEYLLAELEPLLTAKSAILIVRGVGGREKLAQRLSELGMIVDDLPVYQRLLPTIDAEPIIKRVQQRQIAAITISSAEGLENLLTLLQPVRTQLLTIPLIVVSQRIQKIAYDYGFNKVVVSASPADVAVFNTITTVCNGEDSG
ncbi:MAG: hypothetical protein RL637_747 [Pseudomonadota bacterium]